MLSWRRRQLLGYTDAGSKILQEEDGAEFADDAPLKLSEATRKKLAGVGHDTMLGTLLASRDAQQPAGATFSAQGGRVVSARVKRLLEAAGGVAGVVGKEVKARPPAKKPAPARKPVPARR